MRLFHRGINQEFIDALNNLKKDKDSFWHKMVCDPDLFIGIRTDYINVYYNGQSLCRLWLTKGNIKGKTHKKYLGIQETGYAESVNGIFPKTVANKWSLVNLEILKKNCYHYAGVLTP